MDSYLIPIEIYQHDLVLVIGKDDESIKYLNKAFQLSLEELQASINPYFDGATFFNCSQIVICWVRALNNNNTTLLHEIEHASNFILRGVGIEHTEDTEEAYAYLKTYITNKVYDKIKAKRKKKYVKTK